MLMPVTEMEEEIQMGFLTSILSAVPIVGDAVGQIFGQKTKRAPAPSKPNYTPFIIAGGVGLGAILLIIAMRK